jgi:hypothetical protein
MTNATYIEISQLAPPAQPFGPIRQAVLWLAEIIVCIHWDVDRPTGRERFIAVCRQPIVRSQSAVPLSSVVVTISRLTPAKSFACQTR